MQRTIEQDRSTNAKRSLGLPRQAAPCQMSATLVSGPYTAHALLGPGGLSLAQLRQTFVSQLDLGPESVAISDGHEMSNDSVVRPGQTVTFSRPVPEKG
jgi:hypothetical protein